MTDLEKLEAVVADQTAMLLRFAALGNHGTAGPHPDDHPPVEPVKYAPEWVAGWWSQAKRMAAHPGRMGGAITPRCTVVHTTDMLPEEWQALLTAWQTKAGDGACAHFLIGRTPAHGVVQLIPIIRNGNHAGGPGHGVYMPGNIHPNTMAVGIEIHCAGGVWLLGGQWRLVENKKAHGLPIPSSDVIPDPQRPGRGWHVTTDYQRERLAALLGAMEHALSPLPPGCVTHSTGEKVPSWGVPKSARVCGHVSLEPEHRSDPWPPTMATL